jgi:hypothetical protein
MDSKTKANINPETAMQVITQIAESMFGQKKWAEMVDKANGDMKSLIGLEVISRRDRVIFRYALHVGIQYGVAYTHALRQAQKPVNVIKSFFTRKPRK